MIHPKLDFHVSKLSFDCSSQPAGLGVNFSK